MSDVYKVSVALVAQNGISPMLGVIGRDLMGLHTRVKGVEQGFGAWGTALKGVAGILAGGAILGELAKLAAKAADFQDAMTKVSQLNPAVAKLVQSGAIQKQAFNIGANLGMKVEDVTKVYGGVFGVLQDPQEAMEVLPYAAKYSRLMEMRHPGSHPEESLNTVMRAGELAGRLTDDKGAIDPQRVKEWFDTVAKLEAATHGQVNPQTLLALGQQGGGVSLRGLSQEGFEHLAIVAQMMGGHRAGTSLLSLRQQMTGVMFTRNADAMAKYGLLNPGEYYNDHGRTILTDQAKNRLVGLVNRDPMNFVDELFKQLEKRGITDKDKQLQAVSEILGRQTTQRFISDMMLARQQVARETTGLEQGATVDQGIDAYNKNINANLQNLSSAWHNLMVAIGGPEGENFVSVLKSLTGVVTAMTGVARAHPEAIKIVAEGIAALGVALIGAGAAALVGLGAVPVAVTALVAAAAGLVAINWTAITSAFDGIKNAIAGFIDAIAALYGRVKSFFPQGDSPAGKPSLEDGFKYSPMRSDPGASRQKATTVTFNLNLDGRKLATALFDMPPYPTGSGGGLDRFRGGIA